MAEIVQFRPRASAVVQHRIEDSGDHLEIDLVTAIDVAIRDLRDIVDAWGAESSRLQAEECRRMLEEALAAAL